jgi:Tol biopolymer transport system component
MALLLSASPAEAAFPGANGKLAVTAYEQRFASLFNPQIVTLNLDGTGLSFLITDGDSINPSWSPDGSKIAFDRGFLYRDIYTMNADGTGATQVTTDPTVDVDPAWSPDGTKIVFVRSMSPAFGGDLYTTNVDGSATTKLTDGASQPVWSPAGDLIAFKSFASGQIDVVAPNGTGRRPVILGNSPDWSPDGHRIAFESGQEIYTVNVDGSGSVQLTNDPDPGPSMTVSNEDPVWSPDGTRIGFLDTSCNYEVGPEFCSYSFETVNADGSGGRTSHFGTGFQADWQPIPPPEPQRGDYKNAAQYCKALRAFLGDAEFRNRFGGGANAHGKCVSSNTH